MYPRYEKREIYQGSDVVWALIYEGNLKNVKAQIKRKREDRLPLFEMQAVVDGHSCMLYLDGETTLAYKMQKDIESLVYDIYVETEDTKFYIEHGSVKLVRSVTR